MTPTATVPTPAAAAPAPASPVSPDWLATLLAVALAGSAWAGVLPHVGW